MIRNQTRSAAAVFVLGALLAGGGVRAGGPDPAALDRRSESSERAKWKKRWIASWLVVSALNVLDIHSSRGYREANPLYRDSSGRFAPGKAALIKSAIAGGLFASQLWIARSNPDKDHYKPFTLANAIGVGALGAVVAHNYSLPTPKTNPLPAHLAP